MKTYSKNQLQRYPIYLKYLKELLDEGMETISSPKIAKELGYSEEQIRKDLQAICSEAGRPKKGRDIRKLIETLESFLGYRDTTTAVLIGTGHLGGALLRYPNFSEMGFKIIAGFDVDPKKIGTSINGKPVYSLDEFEKIFPTLASRIVIICVPANAAQGVVDLAVKNDARGIWNFAPIHVTAPSNVVIENVNLSSSLAVLSHRLNEELAKEEN